MGGNVSHVCLPKVDFGSFKKSYHILFKKESWAFLLVVCKAIPSLEGF